MTTATIPKAEGDYTTFKHRVYIGVFHPHPEVMFIKVGMTSNAQERIKAYAGMVPGGLSEPVQKLAAVDELEKVGRGLSQARIVSPEPFVDGKRGKKRPARRRR